MILLVNLVGLALIALIAWWFWWPRRRPETVAGDDAVEIVVADGVYRPERIVLDAGKPARLRFVRRDRGRVARARAGRVRFHVPDGHVPRAGRRPLR